MPTDLGPTFARKRAAQAQAQFETTLAWLIICLLCHKRTHALQQKRPLAD
jgi:hypothetical protein